MRITEVSYRRLKSFGSYEHAQVGATAALTTDESPDAALDQLKGWVHAQLEAAEQSKTQREAMDELYWQRRADLQNVEGQIRAAKQWYARAVPILAAHGITLEPLPEDPEQIDLSETPF